MLTTGLFVGIGVGLEVGLLDGTGVGKGVGAGVITGTGVGGEDGCADREAVGASVILTHVMPSPTKPLLHEQPKLPAELVHEALLASQLSVPRAHSSMSSSQFPPSQPVLQVQVYPPSSSVQAPWTQGFELQLSYGVGDEVGEGVGETVSSKTHYMAGRTQQQKMCSRVVPR